jgi:hypothetical protein
MGELNLGSTRRKIHGSPSKGLGWGKATGTCGEGEGEEEAVWGVSSA